MQRKLVIQIDLAIQSWIFETRTEEKKIYGEEDHFPKLTNIVQVNLFYWVFWKAWWKTGIQSTPLDILAIVQNAKKNMKRNSGREELAVRTEKKVERQIGVEIRVKLNNTISGRTKELILNVIVLDVNCQQS